jgi:EAL domain-containing protein (putative c-di-GMP-specific phosphodiesterase class I)
VTAHAKALVMLSRFDTARVVLIDDTPANVDLLEKVLRRAGLRHLHTVTDSREALDTIATVDPDLVVLDLHMPWVDGFTILEETVRRAAGSYLPVLVMTADTTSGASHRALSEGAKDFLTKPFDLTEVLLRVGNLLETRQLHQQLSRQSSTLAGQLGHIRRQETADQAVLEAKHAAVQAVLAGAAIQVVFQPVVDTSSWAILGYEALARFPVEPHRSPDKWFADAADVGLGPALELAAVASALDGLRHIPPDAFLAVNVSVEPLLSPELHDLITPEIAPRLVLELTEHIPVEDYGPVLRAVAALRKRGVRLAVDDTGAGYASLRHILALSPDIIKLDLSLVRDIQHDPARRALAAALIAFATDTNTQLIAEGVETADELDALISLGICWAQGYHLGRPAALRHRQQPSPAITGKP